MLHISVVVLIWVWMYDWLASSVLFRQSFKGMIKFNLISHPFFLLDHLFSFWRICMKMLSANAFFYHDVRNIFLVHSVLFEHCIISLWGCRSCVEQPLYCILTKKKWSLSSVQNLLNILKIWNIEIMWVNICAQYMILYNILNFHNFPSYVTVALQRARYLSSRCTALWEGAFSVP